MGCGSSSAASRVEHAGPTDEPGTGRSKADEDVYDGPGAGIELATSSPVHGRTHTPGSHPRGMSTDGLVAAGLKQKRKGHVIYGESNAAVDTSFATPRVPKDAAVCAMLRTAIRDNPFFAEFGNAEIDQLIEAMERKTVPAGTLVIRQGDPGDNFYAIESGSFEIMVNDRKVADWGDAASSAPRSRSFGELALLYNMPRAASVRAVGDAVLWAIDRRTFRHVLAATARAAHARLKAALRAGLLEDMPEDTLERIASAATTVRYSAGEQIFSKGEEGEVFYIIESGSVMCKNLPGDQSNNVLEAGDYFGERALMRKAPRCADVVAETDVTLIALHKDDFETLFVGPLADLLEYNMGMRTLLCTPVIGGLQADARTAVLSALSIASFKDGDTILQQGTVAPSFFLVKDGKVLVKRVSHASSGNILASTGSRANVFSALPSGRESRESTATASNVKLIVKDVAMLSPGHWFPDRDLDNNSPVPFAYVAVGDVQVFLLDRELYLKHVAAWKHQVRPAASAASRSDTETLSPRSAGGSELHISPYRGPGDHLASPRGPHTGGAAAVPGPAARIEARRFSSDYRTPAAAMSPMAPLPAAAGGMPALRKRLGIPIRELELKATVGTGTFGRVRLVLHRPTNRVFALKMLQKQQIVALKQQANILSEKNILMRVDHPFIIKLYDTYKDRDRLYMLLELVQGGELFARLQNSSTPGRVDANEARFYGSCVLDAFEYLHTFHIIYRDLKPENLLIDADGYIKMVDFGFAKVVKDRTYTLCGTPEYLAPELVLGRGHDKGVDYWALGILLYEQVAGYSPFADRAHNDQMTICKNILKGEVVFPSYFTDVDLKDVILRLLVKDVAKRLGCQRAGAADIKAHRFFRPIDWDQLRSKAIAPPWKPKLRNALDTSHFDPYDERDNVPPYTDHDDWDASF